MSKAKSPPNGPKTPQATPSGRSSSARGSHTRNRSRQMDALVSVLAAVEELGMRGREFGTTEVRDYAKISASQAYTWMQVLRTHGFVEGKITTEGVGNWRWKRCFRFVWNR